MPNSGVIDLAIGIAFVFAVTAAISSVITELIARFLGLRGAYLLLGLRELLDGKNTLVNLDVQVSDFSAFRDLINNAPPAAAATAARPPQKKPGAVIPQSATGALLGSPIISSQGVRGTIVPRGLTMAAAAGSERGSLPKGDRGHTAGLRRRLPSYISARAFADAIIDLLIPDSSGQTTMNAIQHYINELPPSLATLRESLQALAVNAGGDIARFRTSVEHWYDDHMSRVSGWYKRRIAKITLAVGAVLVLLLNINAISIGVALYNDSAVRSAVSTVAARATNCSASQNPQSCLSGLQTQLATAARAGLPLGWGTVADCASPGAHCNWLDQRGIFSRHGGSAWQLMLVLLGFLLTIVALTPGAQFWFGLVSKLGSLRSSGPPPAPPK
jgi:hypothetical protein